MLNDIELYIMIPVLLDLRVPCFLTTKIVFILSDYRLCATKWELTSRLGDFGDNIK